jgi:hypothetical protein
MKQYSHFFVTVTAFHIFRLRKKLSTIFNASVGSRREPGVNFKHKEGDFLSIVINFVFGILSMFHLAYLGVMFDQQETQVLQIGLVSSLRLDDF